MKLAELSERQAFMILNDLPNIGPITLNRLLSEFAGHPLRILAAGKRQLEAVRSVGTETSAAIMAWQTHFDVAREEHRMAQAGADFVIPSDGSYPRLLREIHDPPIGLYRKGVYDFAQPCVAIVGSRRTSLYGLTTARKFAADLVRLGFCVVSGLARGIDTAAHEGAIEAGGKTAAVVGTGIDIIYPSENLHLYRKIAENGAVLSEFPFGRKADRQTFAMRNRIVSGMSEAVIVIESDVDGGAMITAKFAGEQGRLLFAVPGRIDQSTSAGCHQLIRDGATLLTSIDDLLAELSYLDGLRPNAITPRSERPSILEQVTTQLDPPSRLVLDQFRGGSILGVDQISALTQLPAPEISAALMMLELKKLIQKRTDGLYESR